MLTEVAKNKAERELFDEVYAIIDASNKATNQALVAVFDSEVDAWINNCSSDAKLILEYLKNNGYSALSRLCVQAVQDVKYPKLKLTDTNLKWKLVDILTEVKKGWYDYVELREKFRKKIVEQSAIHNI